MSEQKPEPTDCVNLTVFFLEEKEDGHTYLRSKIEKISREEYEEKYAMRIKKEGAI